MSLFSSLDTARRALSAQQAALQTTGNNISNASTPGYTRERVNLQPTTPFPSVGFNQPAIPGQEGTGVEAASVTRIRDSFVDQQVRQQTTSNGYWSAKSDALSQMEGIMNEPSDSGLSKVMNNFWGAWQDLANDPTNSGAQSVVVQDGQTVASTFHYLSNSLTQIKTNIGNNIGVTADQINSIATQINDINKQVANVEPSGMTANTLYDKRDQLVDQLSQLTDIQVTTTPSCANPPAGSAGIYTISLKTQNGNPTLTPLVDGRTMHTHQLTVDTTTDPRNPTVSVGGTPVTAGGKLKGQIDAYSQDFPNMLDKLDAMASQLVSAVQAPIDAANKIITSKDPSAQTIPQFFTLDPTKLSASGAASAINVSKTLQDTPSKVAAGQLVPNDPANLANPTSATAQSDQQIPVALSIANALTTQTYNFGATGGQKATLQGFYQQAIGQMGVNAQQANRMTSNTQSLLDAATQRRDSVSGVSVDEEMTNLIQYQHAYSAAARVVTTINTLLDTVINLGR